MSELQNEKAGYLDDETVKRLWVFLPPKDHKDFARLARTYIVDELGYTNAQLKYVLSHSPAKKPSPR